MKDFIVKSIAKDLLLTPNETPLNISASELSSSNPSQKRKNNLKLAGKWCENEDELPFNTRARVKFTFFNLKLRKMQNHTKKIKV